MGRNLDFLVRQVATVDTTECVEWPFGRNKDGYGQVTVKSKVLRVNRVAFELVNGPLEDGQCVCHSCDNPPCFNPKHLFSATQLINIKDRDEKGRTKHPLTCPQDHPYDGDNLYIRPSDGARICRICLRKSQKKYRQKKRAEQ